MALNIPKIVQALFVQNTDASRVRDTLVTALQPVLDFLNLYMQPNPDGSLTVKNPLTVAGNLTATGEIRFLGNYVMTVRKGGALAVVPSEAGIPFYVTNVGNTAAVFYVTDTGAVQTLGTVAAMGNITSGATVSGANVVSASGFKASWYMGGYWTTTYNANYVGPLQHATRNQSTNALGETPSKRAANSAGSIIGYTINQAGPITGDTAMLIQKNGATLYPSTFVGNGQKTYFGSFNKGAYTFAKGDIIEVFLSTNGNGNTQLDCHLDVEYGA